ADEAAAPVGRQRGAETLMQRVHALAWVAFASDLNHQAVTDANPRARGARQPHAFQQQVAARILPLEVGARLGDGEPPAVGFEQRNLPLATRLGGSQRAAEITVHPLSRGNGDAFERFHWALGPVMPGDACEAAIGHRKTLSPAPNVVIPANAEMANEGDATSTSR